MILVVGATGYVGGMVTRTLLAQGRPLRVLVRRQADSRSLAEAGAQVAEGELREHPSLEAACKGIETVITTATSAGRDGDMQGVDLEGNANLIAAARSAGVRRFVFVSALTADPNSPALLLRAKGQAEATLRQSGMTHTILAPDGYMEVLLARIVGRPAQMGQPVTIVGAGRRKHSFVSAADVAAFIVAATDHPAAANQRLALGGPQPLSLRDAVEIYERVLGHQIVVRSLAAGEAAAGMPVEIFQLLASLDAYDSPVDMTETARTFGVRMTPLEEVVRRTVAAGAVA